MIKKYLLVIIFIINFCPAQIIEPDSLFLGNLITADGLVLSQKKIVEIKNEKNISVTISGKNLIRNKEADRLGEFYFFESDFIKVKNIEVYLTDNNGSIIKELDDEDINYNAISTGSIFYEEDKTVYFDLNYPEYPYTVNYKIELQYKSLFFLPDWYPQNKFPVKESIFEISSPEDITFKWKSFNCDSNPKKFVRNSKNVFKWTVKNIPSRPDENYLAAEDKENIKVLFSPNSFSLGSHKGDFSSWKSVGTWFNSLYQDKYKFNSKIETEILHLTDTCKSAYNKIETLYIYLQGQTRYVAIYTEIGGWEPHKASDIYTNKFGDCKDLTSLMISMLKTVGIKSFPALVRTSDRGIVHEDFPTNQFNHVAAFVPLEKDTLILECTADHLFYNELSSSIEGTNILVLNNSPELIRIPNSAAQKNGWKSETDIDISGKEIKVNSKILLTGNQKKYYYTKLMSLNAKDKNIFIKSFFRKNWGNFELENFKFHTNNQKDTLVLNIQGKYVSYKSQLRKRIFIEPSLFNISTTTSLADEEKEHKFYFKYAYMDTDITRIKLPKNYKVEKLAKKYNYEGELFSLTSESEEKNGEVIFKKTYILKKNSFPSSIKDSFNQMMTNKIKIDKSKIVLQRNALF